jgi:transposase
MCFYGGMMTRDEAQKILEAGKEATIRKLQDLSAEIDRLKSLSPDSPTTPSGQIPVFLKKEKKKRHKKPGQKPGHKGNARLRPRPEDAQRTVHHSLDACPKCGKSLENYTPTIRTRVVEDIPEFNVEIVAHTCETKWCPDCREKVTQPITEALPGSVIGIRLAVFSAFLHYFVGISMHNIRRLLEISSGHSVTIGGLFDIWNRLANLLELQYDRIAETVRNSGVVKADETGWRVMGKLGWLWAFVGRNACIYFIYPFRKSKAVTRFLGKDFAGTLICDFWSAYNKIRAKYKQRCLYHLFTELKKVDQKTSSTDWKAWKKRVVRLMRDSIRLSRKFHQIAQEEYERLKKHMLVRLDDLILLDAREPNIKRLSKRFRRHRTEIFTFLEDPENISPYNNEAERAIRPSVLLRKISQQNRSWKSARVQAILMTVFRTAHLEGKNPFKAVLEQTKSAIAGSKKSLAANEQLKKAA